MAVDRVHIAGIGGSLRAASFNRGLLRVAAAALPDGVTMETVEIGDLPPARLHP